MKTRGLDLSETKLKGKNDRIIHKNYRMISISEEDGKHGVGFLVTEILDILLRI